MLIFIRLIGYDDQTSKICNIIIYRNKGVVDWFSI